MAAARAGRPILVSPGRCPVGAEGGSVEPWSDVEVVEVEPGRSLHLRGCESEGEAFVQFSYVRPLPVAEMHLLEAALYEGSVWIVVSGRTGRQWTLSGAPRLSPDRRWLATTFLDLEAGYHRNHLDVWAVEADSLRRVLALDGGFEWGGTDLRWRSNDTIEFQRVTREGELDLRFDSTALQLIRRRGRWVLEPRRD